MPTLINKFDAIENIIFEQSLKIISIDFHKELDIMLVVLNTGTVFQQKINSFSLLLNATEEELNDYSIIANGTGVHWHKLDEDLSLKGFLNNYLASIVQNNQKTFAA